MVPAHLMMNLSPLPFFALSISPRNEMKIKCSGSVQRRAVLSNYFRKTYNYSIHGLSYTTKNTKTFPRISLSLSCYLPLPTIWELKLGCVATKFLVWPNSGIFHLKILPLFFRYKNVMSPLKCFLIDESRVVFVFSFISSDAAKKFSFPQKMCDWENVTRVWSCFSWFGLLTDLRSTLNRRDRVISRQLKILIVKKKLFVMTMASNEITKSSLKIKIAKLRDIFCSYDNGWW